jgi:hypothetical protein
MDSSYCLQCQGESEVAPKLNSYDPLSVCMQCKYQYLGNGCHNSIIGYKQLRFADTVYVLSVSEQCNSRY